MTEIIIVAAIVAVVVMALLGYRIVRLTAERDVQRTQTENSQKQLETQKTDYEKQLETQKTDYEKQLETQKTGFEKQLETQKTDYEQRLKQLRADSADDLKRQEAVEASQGVIRWADNDTESHECRAGEKSDGPYPRADADHVGERAEAAPGRVGREKQGTGVEDC